jgi:hypothetical protein
MHVRAIRFDLLHARRHQAIPVAHIRLREQSAQPSAQHAHCHFIAKMIGAVDQQTQTISMPNAGASAARLKKRFGAHTVSGSRRNL